jgi:hypothetical protein
MARGGKRTNAGRKPGTVSEATQRRKAVAEKALEEGISPLDVMLITMRSLWKQAVGPDGEVVNIGKAMQANVVAKDAAPFIHPKLASIDANVRGDIAGTMTVTYVTSAVGPAPTPTAEDYETPA